MVTVVTRVAVFVLLVLAGMLWLQLRRILHRLDAEAEALHILARDQDTDGD
jgi:hypothetical protein